MIDIGKAVDSLSRAVQSGFSFLSKCKENQAETELVKDRKNLQKAVDYSERIIKLSYKYYPKFTEEDQEFFRKYVAKFMKYN